MTTQLYVLTDGQEQFATRWMTDEEFAESQREATEATDGNIHWAGPIEVDAESRMISRAATAAVAAETVTRELAQEPVEQVGPPKTPELRRQRALGY